jgi:hypothetical protein
MGLWVVGIGFGPLGHLEAGLLTATIGVQLALVANGVVLVLIIAALGRRIVGLRR